MMDSVETSGNKDGQQLLAVVWSEPLVCQAGAADHYLAEFAYL